VTIITDKAKDEDMLLVVLLPIYNVLLNSSAINPILLMMGSRKVCSQSIYLVLGGLSFYISDNVLGKSHFTDLAIFGDRKIDTIIIMTTYYLAQYFNSLGAKEKPEKICTG
jgi:hypothetical protein